MQAKIEPLSIWEVLDYSVRLYRRHVGKMFLAAAVVGLGGLAVWFVLVRLLDGLASASEATAGAVAALLMAPLIWVVTMAVSFIQAGVLARIIRGAYLEDRVSFSSALRGLPVFSLLVASVLAALLISVGLLLLIVPGLVLLVRLALVAPACGLERRGAFSSLARSWRLMTARMPKGVWNHNVNRVFVIWGFVFVLSFLANTVAGSTAALLPGSVPVAGPEAGMSGMEPNTLALTLSSVFNTLVQAFFRPFGLTALVLLYYDIRIRSEGLDIEGMLERLESGRPGAQQGAELESGS